MTVNCKYHECDYEKAVLELLQNQGWQYTGGYDIHRKNDEPIGALKAHVPADNTGDIMGEVTKRRVRVLGMNPDDDGLQVVEAEVPVAEMQDFTTFLRQLTQGRGYFTFEFVRYETLPQMLENKVIEQAKALGNFADED